MKELYIQQQSTGSNGGDEDYLYEEFLKEKQYWDMVSSSSIFPDDEYYKPTSVTPQEETENFNQIKK